MARYTGPKRKLERRENATLFNNDNWRKRPTPPGQHGASRSRPSSFAIQFREKQKVKRTYGLLEKQFKNLYKKALKTDGNTGVRLLQLLELRLDNVVYRLGFAVTRNQARQLVNHGHVLINGRKVDIPSYTVSPEDTIELSKKIQKSELMVNVKAETKGAQVPEWLDQHANGGKVNDEPKRSHIDKSINEQLIIELYSR
ncbi:30S ribosomal protein S4 [Candidatus Dojkabacteria bacterium]|uniref:Small ribosomal subunit protein uS4 n=1 Tax=Candidatus Dojkabacteria bacterium TaxID=2099670 RepID=A0A955L863_9BACT|nr:30S ribosomal protein S4 [Candidatus Dojkabacteria bacterium]